MKNITFILLFISSFAFAQDEILIDGEPCGMHGSSKPSRPEYQTNVLKNRYSFPEQDDFNTKLSLFDFVNGTATRDKFNTNQAVSVTGYVYDVKKGGIETCNCKTKNSLFRDTHIELTLSSNKTGKMHRFIVEVTPRVRRAMEQKGYDWSTESLKSLKGRMVEVQGWLFYDKSHWTENYADDPNDTIGRRNWRATSWEIHPVTSIEVLDEEVYAAGSEIENYNFDNNQSLVWNNNQATPSSQKNKTMELKPLDTLVIIILAALLGMIGQGMRVIVGIKKANEQVRTENDQEQLFKTQRLVFSLFISFAVGAIAGVLAAINSIDATFSKSMILGFIAAGYAGTDFIEGFMKKNPPK